MTDLFRGVAADYARYRPGYPEAFFALLRSAFRLDGQGTLLDLGCGTGHIILSLAVSFERAIGLDPAPEMLAVARDRAAEQGLTRVEWLAARSDDLPRLQETIGPVRLATLGRSFHWMDRDATLRDLYRLIMPGGGLAVASDRLGSSLLDPNVAGAWQVALREILTRYVDDAARASRRDREPHWSVVARAPFARVEEHEIPVEHCWTLDAVIGHLGTTSFCSPAALGARHAAFVADLRARLAPLEPTNGFRVAAMLNVILAWR